MIAKLLHTCGQEIYAEQYDLRGESLTTFRVNGEQVTTCPTCHEPLREAEMTTAPQQPAADLQVYENPFDADTFNQTYRCSACWGWLVKVRIGTRAWRCQCEECREKTPGYVTARYVEKRFEQDAAEATEARLVLRAYFPHQQTTEAEMIHVLGF